MTFETVCFHCGQEVWMEAIESGLIAVNKYERWNGQTPTPHYATCTGARRPLTREEEEVLEQEGRL